MQLSTVHLGLNIYHKISTNMIISIENSYPWQIHIDQVPNQGFGWIKKRKRKSQKKKETGQLISLLQLKTKIRSVLTKGYRCEWA